MATPIAPTYDIQPRAIADMLAGMAESQQDREISGILQQAQRSLETIAYNRWAARINRQSARAAFSARHKGTREGGSHA